MTEETKIDYEELDDEKLMSYCQTYLRTFSKTKAYMACHPDSTEASALSNAHRTHKNPKVIGFLQYVISEKVMGSDEFLVVLADRARDTSNKQAQIAALKLVKEILFPNRIDVTTNGEKISWQQVIENSGEAAKFGGIVLDK